MLSRNLRQQLVGSFGIGIIGGLGGIVLSYELDVPCGPAIVLVCIACFLISMLLGKWRFSRNARIFAQ